MKTPKKLLSIILAVVMLAGVIAPGMDADLFLRAGALESLQFGSYPQSRVTDDAIITALNASSVEWQSYGYYSGTGSEGNGEMTPKDFMKYRDVTYNGVKYRGVYFEEYRPKSAGSQSTADASYQDDNGYVTNTAATAYWFRFDPLTWRVLDIETGLIMCESIIDAQPYHNYMKAVRVWENGSNINYYFGDANQTFYVNDYYNSDIRQWLTDDFYNIAFTAEEQGKIIPQTLNNDTEPSSQFNSAASTDAVFMLSYSEATNSYYGFYPRVYEDTARVAQGTEYAKCQGLTTGDASWRLRTASDNSYFCHMVASNGSLGSMFMANRTDIGIRPALCYADIIPAPKRVIRYGNYPQSRVTDDDLIVELNENAGDWASYGYYSNMTAQTSPKSFMKYCDVTLRGHKYRGVYFTEYRPEYTRSTSSADNSRQDDNGYTINTAETAYWFEYEPLTWRVLDEDTGLIMCENIIDAQAFNNYVKYSHGQYFADSQNTYYANDYCNSSLRQWLNDDFYNTAFGPSQKSNIVTSTVTNGSQYHNFDVSSSVDYIFILNIEETLNIDYGFSARGDDSRQATGTDYAKCQGLAVEASGSNAGYSGWKLRDDADTEERFFSIYAGGFRGTLTVDNVSSGIRPVCRLAEIKDDTALQVPVTYIEYGTYPQSRVTDSETLAALNATVSPWYSYNYYTGSGTNDDGLMVPDNYMNYRDAVYQGVKYRAVCLSAYRANNTGQIQTTANSYQDNHGYTLNTMQTAYWFRYEPIKWRVLDYDTGLVFCDGVIDAQPYNNFVLAADGTYYGDSDKTYYANDYYNSSIRKWLNENFYKTAFNEEQKANILATELNNDAYPESYAEYNSAPSCDKIFLLSTDEITSAKYSFYANSDRVPGGDGPTDYANSQNAYGVAGYLLRTPANPPRVLGIRNTGGTSFITSSNWTNIGIRPAMRLAEVKDDAEQNIITSIKYGNYPQSLVTDDEVIAALNASDVPWKSYRYYSGDGSEGSENAGDYMCYRDVELNGEKYRGVYFTSYRPTCSRYKGTTAYSYQDNNGYTPNTAENAYWFKFEPLTWRVLDEGLGLVMCESVIDSQPFNNIVTQSDGIYYNENANIANDYANSSLRKWLTDDFYNTAFSVSQKNNMARVYLNNEPPSSNGYYYESTSDKVFLLSYDEVINTYNGFSSDAGADDPAREAEATDYAFCQGLTATSIGFSWMLRTPSTNTLDVRVVSSGSGRCSASYPGNRTETGIRPAMMLAELKNDTSMPSYQTIQFGNYPQSRVTDESLIDELNDVYSPWKSYDYYSGTYDGESGSDDDGSMTAGDFMQYRDVFFNGDKYRAVYIRGYRPAMTGCSRSAEISFQPEYGYVQCTKDDPYWFKYDPLTWRILDEDTGLVMCENAIDAQPYHNYILKSGDNYYNSSGKVHYANNYYFSSLREWLNNDFYNTAFSADQKACILPTQLDNAALNSTYSAPDSTDNIFLLSRADISNGDYGFEKDFVSKDIARFATGTEYAKCQGLGVAYTSGNPVNWWLRTAYSDTLNACCVDFLADVDYMSGSLNKTYNMPVNTTYVGVRPAMRLSELTNNTEVTNDLPKYILYGNYPQSRVTDIGITSELSVNTSSQWISYGYYIGDNEADGNMEPQDFMYYRDVIYNGEKYRGVYFTKYRPGVTEYESSEAYSYQDDNDYLVNSVFWFKFEPLVWRVLDEDSGLVMCENIIDSQAFQNYIMIGSFSCYYGDSDRGYLANSYEHSSLRQWLNDDFYNTAFTDGQKDKILGVELSESYPEDPDGDKIFLLSTIDAAEASYGFNDDIHASDAARCVSGTDYAKCQGLEVYNGKSDWWLRSSNSIGSQGGNAFAIDMSGSSFDSRVSFTSRGVRPAMRLSELVNNTAQDTHKIENYTDISAGETKTVDAAEGEMVYFRFTPDETGIYSFFSAYSGEYYVDTYCCLYDANGYEIINNDDGGEGLNFKISMNMLAGRTYFFGCAAVDNAFLEPYTVTLSTKQKFVNAGDIALHDRKDITVSGGEILRYKFVPQQDGRYYFYSIDPDMSLSSKTSAAVYDAYMYILDADNTSGYNFQFKTEYDFYAGQTYYFDVFINSVYDGSDDNLTLVLEDEFKEVIAAPGSGTVIDYENGYIYGLEPGCDNLSGIVMISDIAHIMEYTGDANPIPSSVYTGFGFAYVNNDNTLGNSYTFILFGDVNCDGKYDGADAFIVNCYISGVLTAEMLGDAKLFAADVNHDGSVTEDDVVILEQAGLLLAQVEQQKSENTGTETDAYSQYLSLIKQNPTAEEETPEEPIVSTQKTIIEKILDFIRMVLTFIRNLFPII